MVLHGDKRMSNGCESGQIASHMPWEALASASVAYAAGAHIPLAHSKSHLKVNGGSCEQHEFPASATY